MFAAKKIQILLFSALLILLAVPGQARVFMFDKETLAPYLQVRSGLSSMGTEPYQWQSAASYSGDTADFIYGGEFGVYLRSSGFGMALGVLVHTFDPITGGKGMDAGGGELFNVESEGLSYGPSLTFDYQFSKTQDYLWKFILGGGYQFAKIENNYSLTAAGQALAGGQNSFNESYRVSAPFAVVGLATEFLMSGTTTLQVMLGYHYSMAEKWQYGQGGQNFAGAHSQGDDVLFEDASTKNINWSYPFLQLGFQFYVDTVR